MAILVGYPERLASSAMSGVTDIELYKAATAGERAACPSPAARHHRYSLRLANSLMPGTPVVAEDVAHRAWLKVCDHIRRVEAGDVDPLVLERDGAFAAWLTTVVKNTVRDEQRAASRRRALDLADHEPTYTPDFDRSLERDEQRSVMWAGFLQLGERCRQLLLLLIEDPPPDYQSIAETLGMRPGSIGPTRARCIEQLRATI